MEPAEGITRLESLREQMYRLETQPRLSVDFLEWYLHTLETFDEIFGLGSRARADFERIRFGLPPCMATAWYSTTPPRAASTAWHGLARDLRSSAQRLPPETFCGGPRTLLIADH
jgi:hypothetical protein